MDEAAIRAREPCSNAEFCRFVAEAKEQRARADAAEAEVEALLAAVWRVLDAAPIQGGGTRINLGAMVEAVDVLRALAAGRPGSSH